MGETANGLFKMNESMHIIVERDSQMFSLQKTHLIYTHSEEAMPKEKDLRCKSTHDEVLTANADHLLGNVLSAITPMY